MLGYFKCTTTLHQYRQLSGRDDLGGKVEIFLNFQKPLCYDLFTTWLQLEKIN